MTTQQVAAYGFAALALAATGLVLYAEWRLDRDRAHAARLIRGHRYSQGMETMDWKKMDRLGARRWGGVVSAQRGRMRRVS